MDFEELNEDRKLLSNTQIINRLIDKGFSERARKMVNQHAIGGATAFAFPLLGLDNVIYAIILWHMYVKICALAKKTFRSNVVKSFIGAAVVNVIIATVLELICNLLPFIGGIIGAAIIGFVSIKVSGAAYLKALEIAYNGNIVEKYNFK